MPRVQLALSWPLDAASCHLPRAGMSACDRNLLEAGRGRGVTRPEGCAVRSSVDAHPVINVASDGRKVASERVLGVVARPIGGDSNVGAVERGLVVTHHGVGGTDCGATDKNGGANPSRSETH